VLAIRFGTAALKGGRCLVVFLVACSAAPGPAATQSALARAEAFVARGEWDEAVSASEEALKTATAADGIPAACGRAATWVLYGYLQQGRYGDARRTLLDCSRQLTTDDGAAWVSLAVMRSHYLVETEEPSGEIVALAIPDVDPAATFYREYASGFAAIGRRELPQVRQALSRMETARQALTAADAPQRTLSPTNAARLQIMRNQLGALLGGVEGAPLDASRRLVTIAEAEDALPHEPGPPSIHKPSWELAGEALTYYDAGQARAAFERVLAQHPGRAAALSGLHEVVAVQGDVLKAAEVKATLDAIRRRADAKKPE
jgi:tetratricopeptide (TPR) repeat protein